MIQLFKDKEPPLKINFRVEPRDFMKKSISLPLETIHALNKAARILKKISNGQYEIILTRGHVNWNGWRYFRGMVGAAIFCLLYWSNRSDVPLLFGSNGHEDGFSVDIQIYDVLSKKGLPFLSWQNIMMQRVKAEKILEDNDVLVNMLDASMKDAGFIRHPDPRERLQMHYRLVPTGLTDAL